MDTVFDQILAKKLPANVRYEDEHCMVIDDLHPQAPMHVLVLPKKRFTRLSDVTSDDTVLLGTIMTQLPAIAKSIGMAEDFRVVINNGPQAGQVVFYLHIHMMGGKHMDHDLR